MTGFVQEDRRTHDALSSDFPIHIFMRKGQGSERKGKEKQTGWFISFERLTKLSVLCAAKICSMAT